MGTGGNTVATVRFRTLAAHEWTEDPDPIRLQAPSELARDLRYQPVKG